MLGHYNICHWLFCYVRIAIVSIPTHTHNTDDCVCVYVCYVCIAIVIHVTHAHTHTHRRLCVAPPLTEQCDLLREWVRGAWWEYAITVATEVDRERYWEVVSHSLKKYFNQYSKVRKLLQWCMYIRTYMHVCKLWSSF